MKFKKETGSIVGFGDAKSITNDELLETECPIYSSSVRKSNY